ncbi:MAG: hypothetical protein ABSG64_02610 [Solirubrobacteraceae bacterium]
MDVTLVLCDAVQESGGKLSMLGGGWTHALTADVPFNLGLGLIIAVPWDRTNEQHTVRAVLLTEDGDPVSVNGTAIENGGGFELGRPPGLKRGTTLNAVLAMQFNGLQLPAGGYVWEVLINDEQRARAPFWVVARPGS